MGVIAEAHVTNFGPRGEIATGICFLDHMIDQLTAHAQLGVSVRVSLPSSRSGDELTWLPMHRDYAGTIAVDGAPVLRPHDHGIFAASGEALGVALRRVVLQARNANRGCDVEDSEEYRTKRQRLDDDSSSGLTSSVTVGHRRNNESGRPQEDKGLEAAAAAAAAKTETMTTFFCPLDEALAEARVSLPKGEGLSSHIVASHGAKIKAAVSETRLHPYGCMPPGGRTWVGCYRCDLTPIFWAGLAEGLGEGAAIFLRKVRGANAHHIIEATFKAFARAFRAALDEDAAAFAAGGGASRRHGCVGPFEDRARARANVAVLEARDGADASWPEGGKRCAEKMRSTKETSISVRLDLDLYAPDISVPTATAEAQTAPSLKEISTGVALLDRLLAELRRSGGFDFRVDCSGDTYIDDHHTAEDVAITLGQCLLASLGDKKGLARMGCAEACSSPDGTSRSGQSSQGRALVRVVIDLSNRPHFESNLEKHLDEEYVGGAPTRIAGLMRAGDSAVCGQALTCEMLVHFFESLTLEMRATGHVEVLRSARLCEVAKDEEQGEGALKCGGDAKTGASAAAAAAEDVGHTLDIAMALARAYGAALAECVRVDPRRAGQVASSKGTLSA
jgi:imidazoleglycerol-phosphate dehydratase